MFKAGVKYRGHWNGGDIIWHEPDARCELCELESKQPRTTIVCTSIDAERGIVTYSTEK